MLKRTLATVVTKPVVESKKSAVAAAASASTSPPKKSSNASARGPSPAEVKRKETRTQLTTKLLGYKEEGASTELGKYVGFGNLITTEEIPRVLAKTEWDRKAFRSDIGKYDLLNGDPKAALKTPTKKDFEAEKIHCLPHEMRHLMARKPAADVIKTLQTQGEDGFCTPQILIGGRGQGKSATLVHLVSWARLQGWLTIYVPRASDFVTESGMLRSNAKPVPYIPTSTVGQGLYQQPSVAEKILHSILTYHGTGLADIPQRRKYAHDFYSAKDSTNKPTLAHILMRGLASAQHSADALYDLRMEFGLVEEVPVLIAIDEVEGLYWPTELYHLGKQLRANQLVTCNTFRFLQNVPGDVISATDDHRIAKVPTLDPLHKLRRGAIVAASTKSLMCPSNSERIAGPKFDDDRINFAPNVAVRREVPNYDLDEFKRAVSWYQARGVVGEREFESHQVNAMRAVTDSNPERLFKKMCIV